MPPFERSKILVVEPKWTGHYPMFAALTAEALRTLSPSVTLSLTVESCDEPGCMAGLAAASVTDRVEVRRSLPNLTGGYSPVTEAGGRLEWSLIAEEVARIKPDMIVLPSADAVACVRPGRRPSQINAATIAGCVHGARFGYGGRGLRFLLRREWMRRRWRQSGIHLGSMDPIAVRNRGSLSLRILPHPLSMRSESPTASRSLPLNEQFGKRRVILAIGEHSNRKRTDRLILGWPDPAPENAVLVVAGRRGAEVDDALESRRGDLESGRIVSIDRTLSTPEFDGLLERADVTTAIYQQHVGISGVVFDAARLGTAVLASQEGGIGHMVKEHGLGRVIPSADDAVLAAALADVASEDPRTNPALRDAFVKTGSKASVAEAWERLIPRTHRV
ncbi:MAG: hypothetical protein CMJ51_07450 [Planctomycetaceae bacterium]|nr:hypothetical protein [Planctomycetaceae bacterium]